MKCEGCHRSDVETIFIAKPGLKQSRLCRSCILSLWEACEQRLEEAEEDRRRMMTRGLFIAANNNALRKRLFLLGYDGEVAR